MITCRSASDFLQTRLDGLYILCGRAFIALHNVKADTLALG